MKTVRILLSLLFLGALLTACAAPLAVVNSEYVLTSAMRDGKFLFLGVDGPINGLANPALRVKPGERVTLMLVNGGEGAHDLVIPALNIQSDTVHKKGETTSVTFTAPTQSAALEYFDSGLGKMGMKGVLLVGDAADPMAGKSSSETAPSAASAPSEAAAPAEIQVKPTGVTVEYALVSGLMEGKMVFLGKGGQVDGKMNPDLRANPGDTVHITLSSGEGAAHNLRIDEFHVQTADAIGQNTVTAEFMAGADGTYAYFCNIAGHRQAGMEGKLIVGTGVNSPMNMLASSAGTTSETVLTTPADPRAVDITRDPTDLPAPIGTRGAEHLTVNLESVEVSGKLADGSTYRYWTFGGKVPGPFLRVRVGDTVDLHLKNLPDSSMNHSIDLHAVTGPGGGAVFTQTSPGTETSFTFKALNPGLYVYHCATPMIPQHISNGMYGLILVEPEGGLPKVDREFYVMQGEIYTAQPFGTAGDLTVDTTKLLAENPEYFVFNGASMALTSKEHMLKAKTGETVRIFFGVGGPNFTSSFHVIGEIFDRVFDQASLTAHPLTDVQTTLVPPGGATMVEFKLDVPGRYILVDHALSRMMHGLAGYLMVDGDPQPEIINGTVTAGSGH